MSSKKTSLPVGQANRGGVRGDALLTIKLWLLLGEPAGGRCQQNCIFGDILLVDKFFLVNDHGYQNASEIDEELIS